MVEKANVQNLDESGSIWIHNKDLEIKQAKIIAKEPYKCTGCGAYLNYYSKILNFAEYNQQKCKLESRESTDDLMEHVFGITTPKNKTGVNFFGQTNSSNVYWICEVCDNHNEFSEAASMTKPISNEFFLKKKANLKKFTKAVLIVCDTSSSLGGSGIEKLKNHLKDIVKNYSETSPATLIGIISFNSEITIMGDEKKQYVYKKEFLQKKSLDELLIIGGKVQMDSLLFQAAAGINHLYKLIDSLAPDGLTALGPAMAFSLGIAKKIGIGTNIINITDGVSNIGVGKLMDPIDIPNARDFYKEIGAIARKSGVVMNFIYLMTDKSGCKYKIISAAIVLSGGKGDAIEVDEKKSLLSSSQNNIIITNARLTLFLNSNIKIIWDNNTKSTTNKIIKDIGNMTLESKLFYKYTLVDKNKTQNIYQIQLEYHHEDGNEYLRVINGNIIENKSSCSSQSIRSEDMDLFHSSPGEHSTLSISHEYQTAANDIDKGNFAGAQAKVDKIKKRQIPSAPQYGQNPALLEKIIDIRKQPKPTQAAIDHSEIVLRNFLGTPMD